MIIYRRKAWIVTAAYSKVHKVIEQFKIYNPLFVNSFELQY